MPQPRPVRPDELPELGRLLNSVFRLPRGITDQHMLSDFPLLFRPQNLDNCRVIVEQGRIVSHAGLWPREMIVDGTVLKVGVLVAVATHPDYRKRGYAARIVADLMRTMQENEFDLGILWTGVPGFYEQWGWKKVTPGGYAVSWDEADFTATAIESAGYELMPYDRQAHLDGILALNEAEPVRMVRAPDDLAIQLRLPKISVSVAVDAGRVAACLVSSRSVNKPGLIESRGAADGIVALVVDALSNPQAAKPVRWLISPTHNDLADWARLHGWPVEPLVSSKGTAHEMVLVCRPERVPEAILRRLFVWGLDLA